MCARYERSPTNPMTPRLARLLFTHEIACNKSKYDNIHPLYEFHFDFRAREAEHLIASLSAAEIPTLLSRDYPVRFSTEPVKSFIYQSLYLRALQVLGAPRPTAPGYDAYVEWRLEQLELFRELLARIQPRPGYSSRTLTRLARRVDQEVVGLRVGKVQVYVNLGARRGSRDLIDELHEALRENWEVTEELREAVLAVDRCP
jgi:hypothetical protein